MPTINELVEELLAVREQLEGLTGREKEIREQLRQQLMQENRQTAYIQSSRGMIRLRRQAHVKIAYNEALLMERLGAERFGQLASVDRNKLRAHWDELPSWLGEHFFAVASLDRKRVKEAVESGMIDGQLFAGAFTKESQEILSVTPMTPGAETPDGRN